MARLTSAQLTALKNNLAANTATVVIGGTTVQIKDVEQPASDEAADKVRDWYNLTASPAYVVWDHAAPLKRVRAATDIAKFTPTDSAPASPSTDMTYQNRALQCQLKQANAFFLVQGEGTVDCSPQSLRLSFNDCITGVPSGANGVNQNAGWGSAASPGPIKLAMQRTAKNGEKVLATQPANSGPAGNTNADGRGVATNPDALGIDANGSTITALTSQDIKDAWAAA